MHRSSDFVQSTYSKLQKLLKVEASTFPVGEMFLFSWEISWEMFLGLEVPVTVVVINIY